MAPWSVASAGPAATPAIFISCMSASSTRAAIFIPARSIPANACRNGRRSSDVAILSSRRQDHRAAFAEADARKARLGAKAAGDDLGAVLDETALVAGRHWDRLASARREFEETAPARFVRAGTGARAEEVADREIAAVAGMMGDHLRDGPVRCRERRLGETLRRGAGATH